MLTGTNLLYAKQFNLRIVHETIRLFGPLSRAEVARRTALTGQTVSNLARELIELGLVLEAERRSEGRGAPAMTLAVNPDGAFAIGLDFNRDHLTGVLVDLAGTVRQRAHMELDLLAPRTALDLMVGMVDSLVARQAITRELVCGVGIGIPGPMVQGEGGAGDDYVVNPKAFPEWHHVPLASWLRDRLGLPVVIENNATAAALGERWYGAGRQIGTFFYLFFGSGLGGALVIDGRPYEGATGNAGELGYIPSTLGGDASTHAGLHFNLPRLYDALRADGVEARTPEALDRLLAEGHPRLLAWMDSGADCLAGLLLAVEYLLDPEAIFFGGRLPDRMLEGFMTRVARLLPARRIAEKESSPRHLLGTAGSDAAALGVATLPIYRFFAPAPQVLLKPGKRRAAAGLGSR